MGKKNQIPQRGRAASSNPDNRYSQWQREAFDDGWDSEQPIPAQRTRLQRDNSQSVLVYNQSPDVPFDRAINPYRGCEHGCIYCFARPGHAYLDLSPGLDFERELFYKPEAAMLLRQALAKPSYRCKPIALGMNTDAYQPVERDQQLTRQLLTVMCDTSHPVSLITKSSLIERDLDLLAELAQRQLVSVAVSITTLEPALARRLEPRAAAPKRRLQTIERLSAAGVPVTVMIAPLIPVLSDQELEAILSAARAAGAGSARYIFMRLPHEVKTLFEEWLQHHYPDKAAHVLTRIRDAFGGNLYQAEFGRRMTGSGPYAQLLAQRFALACKKLEFGEFPSLRCDLFRPPPRHSDSGQLDLFG